MAYRRPRWHTDGLRDLFHGRLPQPTLNVGPHLDRCTRAHGGLRMIPVGGHRQGSPSMCFRTPCFVWLRPDPVCIETEPGDLTLHDGRLCHRVGQSSLHGAASLRRSMSVPYLTGQYEPKSEEIPTPACHRLSAGRRSRVSVG